MSVEPGGGFPGDDGTADDLRNAGRHVPAYLYETFAALLFDYCEALLGDEVAATIAVQDTLVTVDSKIGKLPDSGQLRVQLYSAARRKCRSRPVRERGKAPRRSEGTDAAGDAGHARRGGAAEPDMSVVTAALSELADRDREVLNLAFRHGIESADLAAVLGVSPRRARAMLSDAGTRFSKAAAVVAGQNGGKVLGPELIARVPLAAAPLTLRLRLTRTALALGSHRRRTGKRSRAAGGLVPARRRARAGRGLPHAVVVSSLGLVVLAAPGAMLYKLATGSGADPLPARMASGVQTPTSASSLPGPPGPDQSGAVHRHSKRRPPLPGLGPAPLGEMTVPTPQRGGSPTTPPPHTTPPTTPAPTTPPSTTTPPTTPPPTTPPPTTPPPTTPPPTTPPPTTPPPTTPPPTTPPPTTPPPTTPPPTTSPTGGATPT